MMLMKSHRLTGLMLKSGSQPGASLNWSGRHKKNGPSTSAYGHQRRFTRKTVRKASDAYSITLSARAIANPAHWYAN